MAHTDLDTCNKALDAERETAERYEDYLASQIVALDKEADEKRAEASALRSALSAYRQFRTQKGN